MSPQSRHVKYAVISWVKADDKAAVRRKNALPNPGGLDREFAEARLGGGEL